MPFTGDDWALRANLQLCGSVSPPTYSDLRTTTHLQTFDVRNGGATLWSDNGKLFLVNLFHQSQFVMQEETLLTPKEQVMQHVMLDPPLPPHDVAQVEQIKLNASGSQMLLLAKSWLKVLRLPVESKGKPQSGQQRTGEAKKKKFLVRFEDGSEQDVTLKEEELRSSDDVLEQVKRRAASGKRVAFVSQEQGVAAVRSVGYFSNVHHAAWHPLSDTHLVVLSDAEEIEMFNTQHDVSKPEQRHRLDFPTKARATKAVSVSFCLGASIQFEQHQAAQINAAQIWDAFTCYVLRSDGAVYAMCPLVPYNCCASKTFLQMLNSEVDAQIAICKQKIEATGSGLQFHLLGLKSQKYWLQEGWAQLSRRDIGRRAQDPSVRNAKTNLDAFCFLSPHKSGISPDTWPLDLQGPIDVTPQSVVEGKNQVSGGSSATSLLVMPLASRDSAENRSVSASPFLMRTFTSGHVELILLDAPIRPQWRSHRQSVAMTTVRKLPALLVECLNLGIDDSGGKAVLERDATNPRLVYCLHSTGVHVINVGWVIALASGKQFTTLPKSSVRHVFSVSPNSVSPSSAAPIVPDAVVSNVVGVRVVKNVNFGHLLLLRLASGNFEVVNVSAASSELLKGVLVDNRKASTDTHASNLQKTLPGTLASMASSKSRALVEAYNSNTSEGGIRPFGDIVEEKLEALSSRGTRVTGNTLMHEVDDAVLAFVLERVKILYEDVEYVDEIDQLMHDRLQLHATMIKAHAEKVVLVQKNADDASASMKKLQEKTARALAVQQNLSKRAAAVLQAVKENQPHLSRAEREFKTELELMAVEVRRIKSRVAELTVQGQCAVRSLESSALSASSLSRYWSPLSRTGPSSVLSTEKKKMCFDVLRAETQLIDNTKVLLEDLSTDLQQMKE